MKPIEAIYQGGVFKPLVRILLPENQRVRLDIQELEGTDVRAWLEEVRRFQQEVVGNRGIFPDSTPDIAVDRSRDE